MPMSQIIMAWLGRDDCVLATLYSTNKDRHQRGKEMSPMSPALGDATCCLSTGCAEGFQNDGRGPGRTSRAPEQTHFVSFHCQPMENQVWLGAGAERRLWLCPSMQPPAQVPCSSLSCTHLGSPAFGAAPCSLGPASWNSQSKGSPSSSSSQGVLPENPRCCRERAVAQ